MAKKGYASVTISASANQLVIALAEYFDRSKGWVIEEAVKFYIEKQKLESAVGNHLAKQ